MSVDISAKELAREDFCRLLSACYYQPGPEFAEEDVFGSLLGAAALIDPALEERARQMGRSFAELPLETVLLDYSRLFLGPFHIVAKPYGSIWMEGEKIAMGESTVAVLDLYREGGFDLDEDFREMPDHIAVELEFLYLLLFKQGEARRNDDAQELAKLNDLKSRFLEQHLGRWVAPFTDAVKAGAETVFYRTLAELTASFVQLEPQAR
jgi:TorA maturation chaperone TorD